MSKRTAWFLIIFLGSSFSYLFFIGAPSIGFPKMLAQVGIVVGVAPNPYNTLNDQLQQEKTQLDAQQADLAAREAAFASSTNSSSSSLTSPAIWCLSIVVGILAMLVILNFYFDWKLSREISAIAPVHPETPEEPKE